MTTDLYPWSPAERAAWAPPEDITVSQWAGRYREIPKSAAFSGLWDNTFGPYAVEVMDAFNDPMVEQITIMASIQSMKTECAYNMLGWAICQDPGPALLVMPTLELVHKANRRLRTMLRISEELARHLTGNPDDLRMKTLSLDRMDLNFATAGSEADLQFVEARYLIEDETDLFPPGAVKMGIDRTTTFWNRKVVVLSRPTVPEGHIFTEYQRSDRRKFWVPCPRCGAYQVLSFWQVKHRGEVRGQWPEGKRDRDYIIETRAAVYECEHCGAEIEESDKNGMLRRGKWVPEGHPFEAATGAMAPPPPARHRGYWWNILYSPFKSWSQVAAEFFTVKGEPADYRIFVNQWLAEPWKEIVESQPASYILSLRTRRPGGVVPEDTLALTAGIDSQRRGFWVVIRAWVLTAEGLRESHKIRHGWVANFGELERWLFEDVYRTAGPLPVEHRVWAGLIDTGGGLMGEGEATLTEQVYNWLRRSGRNRIFGSKGSSKPLHGRLWVRSTIEHYPSGKPLPGGLVLYRLDTAELKEFIFARIKNGLFHLDGGPDLSFKEEEIPEADKVYAEHLSAEVKERRKGKVMWTVQKGRANHLLDCEVMAAAAAEAFNVWLLPRPQAAAAAPAGVEADRINPFTGRPPGEWLRR
jgi:phage terminase large subunit GpA-like protein